MSKKILIVDDEKNLLDSLRRSLSRRYDVACVASLNSIMVDATGMCGACMVPVVVDGRLVRKHACIDGPEIDSHIIDWDKFLPRFGQFRAQEQRSRV